MSVDWETEVFRKWFFLSEQGSLTIVRRSSSSGRRSPGGNRSGQRHSPPVEIAGDDETETVDVVDLAADNLPAVDTPDACDKAALR